MEEVEEVTETVEPLIDQEEALEEMEEEEGTGSQTPPSYANDDIDNILFNQVMELISTLKVSPKGVAGVLTSIVHLKLYEVAAGLNQQVIEDMVDYKLSKIGESAKKSN
jgi:hypothetical protein